MFRFRHLFWSRFQFVDHDCDLTQEFGIARLGPTGRHPLVTGIEPTLNQVRPAPECCNLLTARHSRLSCELPRAIERDSGSSRANSRLSCKIFAMADLSFDPVNGGQRARAVAGSGEGARQLAWLRLEQIDPRP